MPPRLSTSKAYWNLRAEQVMDRVFSDGDQTFEAVRVQVETPASTSTTHSTSVKERPLSWPQVCLAGIGVIAVLGSAGLTLHWQRTQQALERERNIALIERLRLQPSTTGESSTSSSQPSDGDTAEAPSSDKASDPALLPSDITITTLPSTPQAQLEPITLPIPAAATAPASSPEPTSIPAEPLLVGVVYSGNGGGSAIFQLGNLSVSTFPGERIGNSGWTLSRISANGAVIERGGSQRSLSVGGAF